MNNSGLKYVYYVDAAPQRVWECLTSPEEVGRIYYGSVIRSEMLPGADIAYVGPGAEGEETVHVYGKILDIIPGELLRFTHFPGPAYVKDGLSFESVITWKVEPAGSCTRLTLIHDGWDERDPSRQGSDDAWPVILSNTKTLAETGKTLNLEG